VVVLSNPLNPSIALAQEQMKAAAQSLGIEIHVVEVEARWRTPPSVARCFAAKAAAAEHT
jgi:hypothetical protein